MAHLSLIPQPTLEAEKTRKLLLISLKKRRLVLQKLVLRNETLKVKLDMLKREYMVKIGSLVVKDNHLDLDIIRYRNIIKLMEEGKTYAEATEELSTTFYAEQLEIEQEEESIRQAERIFEKGITEKSDEVQADAKKLWRKLISLFHPDLTQDIQEKKRREIIMQHINLAYEEGDVSKLAGIEREHTVTQDTPMERLEDMLGNLENEIIEQEKQFVLMKESEWYRWHIKISKVHKTLHDIFSDVEKKLLDDIVTKIEIVKLLKKEIETLSAF